MKTGLDYETPILTLISTSGDLSVHQQIAYHTLLTVHKSITNKKPRYIYERLCIRTTSENRIFPHRQSNKISVNGKLTLTRGGFIYYGVMLFNQLPIDTTFKTKVKLWISKNISISPISINISVSGC